MNIGLKRKLMQSKIGSSLRWIVHNIKLCKTHADPSKVLDMCIEETLTSQERESIIKDMVYTARKLHFSYEEYFTYNFRNKTIKERKEFIPSLERIYKCERMNKAANWEIFENKAKTYEKYKKYYKRDCVLIYKSSPMEEKINALTAFADLHPKFIIKSLGEAGGKGIEMVDLFSVADKKEFLTDLLLKRDSFICEEIIIQADEMAKLHPQSVNTVRITTVRFDDRVEIIHPALRIGIGNNIVDNAGSSGICCAVDKETGRVLSVYDECGRSYEIHPDTGVSLIGFEIPQWEEAILLAKELAQVVPDNRYTGWDLALTNQGWVMVEANSYGGFVIWQMSLQKGFRKECNAILKELKR